MRRTTISTAAVALVIAGAVATASPAAAEPSPQASCVGQVFVPQATGNPKAIAERIAEIKGFIEEPWGQVVSELLAHWDGCKAG